MHSKERKPEIRFNGFLEKWEQNKVGQLCLIETGKSNTQDQVVDGRYPFYIRSDKPVRSNKYLYDCEAVITIGDGNIGKVFHYVNGKFDLHQRCYKMSDFKGVTGKYFYYYFSTKFYDRAIKMTAKATVDSVRLDMISKMDIYYPKSKEEQNKIANCLTYIDSYITFQKDKYTQLVNMKQTLLEKMFPHDGAKTPEIRFAGYKEDWRKGTIGDYGNFYYGHSAPKWSITSDARIPCVRYGELYTKFGNKIDKIYSYTNIPAKKLTFSKGTEVLIPRVGEDPMDYTHCSWLSLANVAIGEMISVYNTGQNPLFTAIMFNATLKDEFAKRVEGGSVTNLYYDKLKDIVVSFPSKEEQMKIASLFEAMDKQINKQQQLIKQLQNIKQSFLDKMLVS